MQFGSRLAPAPVSVVQVVDCLVNSQRVGVVVDQAMAERDRLGIEAVWLHLGVIDEAAAERAHEPVWISSRTHARHGNSSRGGELAFRHTCLADFCGPFHNP